MVVAANKVDLLAAAGGAADRASVAATDVAGAGEGGGAGVEAADVAGAGDGGGDGVGLAGQDSHLAATALVEQTMVALGDMFPDMVPISAQRGDGLGRLLAAVDRELSAQLVPVEATIPYAAGDVLNQVHTFGVVDAEAFQAGGTRVTARVPPYLLGALAEYRVDGGRGQAGSG
jgi:hypothetical protein